MARFEAFAVYGVLEVLLLRRACPESVRNALDVLPWTDDKRIRDDADGSVDANDELFGAVQAAWDSDCLHAECPWTLVVEETGVDVVRVEDRTTTAMIVDAAERERERLNTAPYVNSKMRPPSTTTGSVQDSAF